MKLKEAENIVLKMLLKRFISTMEIVYLPAYLKLDSPHFNTPIPFC